MDIRSIVKRLIKKHNTNDPFEIASNQDIIVLREPLCPDVKGFYQYCKRNKLIYINNNLPEQEQIIVCAHELGHANLHTYLNVVFLDKNTLYVKNKYEIEANLFSAHLLVPDDIIFKDNYKNFTIDQIAAAEGVSVELLKLKL